MESQGIDPSGGLKPPAFRKLRSTTEFVAIAFTTASFQNLRVKRCEVRRSPRKRKKWRKTVARSNPRGKSPLLDSSRCPKNRFNGMACSLELPRTDFWTASKSRSQVSYLPCGMRQAYSKEPGNLVQLATLPACALRVSPPWPELTAVRTANRLTTSTSTRTEFGGK